MTKDELGLGKLVETIQAYLASPHESPALSERLHREAADALTALIAERDALARRVSGDDRRRRIFRRNVRLRLDAEARAEAAEAQLKAARETLIHVREAIDPIHEDHFGHGHVSDSRGQVTSYPLKLVLLAEIRSTLNLTVKDNG